MSLDKIKLGFNQYTETRYSPVLVYIGILCLIVIALAPRDIVEKSLSESGFTIVYILLLCIIVLIGNLDKGD